MLQQYCEHGGDHPRHHLDGRSCKAQRTDLAAQGKGSQPLQGGGSRGTRAHSCRAVTQRGASELHVLSHRISVFMNDC